MKIKILPVLLNIVLTILGVTSYHFMKHNKIAYVDAERIFNEFKMKKELEQKLVLSESERKGTLDSLELKIKMFKDVEGDRDNMYLETLKREYFQKRQEFGEYTDFISDKYNDQIWKRIRQYIKDYGSQNGYHFIYGQSDAPTLLYSDAKEDITEQVLIFMNKKYEGE